MNMGLVGMEDISAALDFHAFDNASAELQLFVLENTLYESQAGAIQNHTILSGYFYGSSGYDFETGRQNPAWMTRIGRKGSAADAAEPSSRLY